MPIDSAADIRGLFSLQGTVALVTGGSGVLGATMARGLARAGARVAVMGRRIEPCVRVADDIRAAGGEALPVAGDVLDLAALERVAAEVETALGPLDILVCAAGGNQPAASTSRDVPFFDLDAQAVDAVLASNFAGTFRTCQVVGRRMAERGQGNIITIASMTALRPLTRVVAYSAAKAAVVSLTQWLAVYMAREHSPHVRVNAIAPGFFLTEQNRYLMTDAQTGAWTERGQAIVAHTPMGRLGAPEDLVGALLWLASPASAFVTGIVVPVDGGYSAFGGV